MVIVFFLKAPFFNLKEFSIDIDRAMGTNNELELVNYGQLNQLLEPYLGYNLFLTDVDELSAAIRTNFPAAKEIGIVKKVPDTISVVVKEEEPSVILVKEKGYQIMASSGQVIWHETSLDLDKTFLSDVPRFTIQGVAEDTELYSYYINYIVAMRSDLLLRDEEVPIKFSVTVSEGSVVWLKVFFKKHKVLFSLNKSVEGNTEQYCLVKESLQRKKIKYSAIDLRFNDPIIKK